MVTHVSLNTVSTSTTIFYITALRQYRECTGECTSQIKPHSVKLRWTEPEHLRDLSTDKPGRITVELQACVRILEIELHKNVYVPTLVWKSIWQ